jgi:transposase
VPADTLRVAKAAFAKGNPYLTLHDELGPIFEDADFTELFSEVGQSAIPPWRLLYFHNFGLMSTFGDPKNEPW